MNKNNEMDVSKIQTLVKHSALIQISRKDISATQQKAYNLLLYVARERLKDEHTLLFKIDLSNIVNFLGMDIRNVEYLKEQLKALVDTAVEYNILGKDHQRWGYFSLLAGVEFIKDNRSDVTTVEFQLPVQIVRALSKNQIYAKLNLKIIKGLKSKYSIALYELVKDYEKVGMPEIDITTFRKLLGIERKYKNFQELKKYVLDKATQEINKNKNISFTISYRLKKKGTRYTHIKFIIKKKPKLTKIEKSNKTGKPELEPKQLKLEPKKQEPVQEPKQKQEPDKIIKTLSFDTMNENEIVNIITDILLEVQRKQPNPELVQDIVDETKRIGWQRMKTRLKWLLYFVREQRQNPDIDLEKYNKALQNDKYVKMQLSGG